MFYVDSQRCVTRRSSSLLRRFNQENEPSLQTKPSSLLSQPSIVQPDKGKVRNELVTMMFESMLSIIVQSWEPMVSSKPSDIVAPISMNKSASSLKKKKKAAEDKLYSKSFRSKSRLKIGLIDMPNRNKAVTVTWWSAPDEKVIIHFKNGNMYEGNISKKCMHGEGRFQWANGTVYLGQFKNNRIEGKGKIQWKDDTWYEGEFLNNLRHGKGLYVDSRQQLSYAGEWYLGAKHGQGFITYNKTFTNTYDGQWFQNTRLGIGSREYCKLSGYSGEWENNIRGGKGIMVWPNHDCYIGDWKNNLIHGYGIYIWDNYYNNTMSFPALKAYRGWWKNGKRNGYGILNFGSDMGSYYKGKFKNNYKNGPGKLVTNNGEVLENKQLFIEDSGPFHTFNTLYRSRSTEDMNRIVKPWHYDICDITVGLSYHIKTGLINLNNEYKNKNAYLVDTYLQNNSLTSHVSHGPQIDENYKKQIYIKELIYADCLAFEEKALRNAIRYYENDLRCIYYKYATIFNTVEIHFNPIMIRLYLWQLYYDCNIHEFGVTLYDIDVEFYNNRDWLARNAHDPFEKLYFWQFLHAILLVANKVYPKRSPLGPRPDTILSSCLISFMENVVLPGSRVQKGRMKDNYCQYVPLKAMYALQLSLGDPISIRTFLKAVRKPCHLLDVFQPQIIDMPYNCIPWGCNAYMLGDDMAFLVDFDPEKFLRNNSSFKLFNIANVPIKRIIKIFADIFPNLICDGKVMDVEIKLTFFEFFEAFIACIEESIKIGDRKTIPTRHPLKRTKRIHH